MKLVNDGPVAVLVECEFPDRATCSAHDDLIWTLDSTPTLPQLCASSVSSSISWTPSMAHPSLVSWSVPGSRHCGDDRQAAIQRLNEGARIAHALSLNKQLTPCFSFSFEWLVQALRWLLTADSPAASGRHVRPVVATPTPQRIQRGNDRGQRQRPHPRPTTRNRHAECQRTARTPPSRCSDGNLTEGVCILHHNHGHNIQAARATGP